MIHVYTARVTNVVDRHLQKHAGGVGKDAIFETNSTGTYITLENHISLYVEDNPEHFTVGDTVTLTLARKP